nr:hypothetical protein Iba_contig1567CG0010 [Ipomoea batatas]
MKLFLGVRVLGFFSGDHPPPLLSLIWSLLGPGGSRRCSAASTRRQSAGKVLVLTVRVLLYCFIIHSLLRPASSSGRGAIPPAMVLSPASLASTVEAVCLSWWTGQQKKITPCSGASGVSSSSTALFSRALVLVELHLHLGTVTALFSRALVLVELHLPRL